MLAEVVLYLKHYNLVSFRGFGYPDPLTLLETLSLSEWSVNYIYLRMVVCATSSFRLITWSLFNKANTCLTVFKFCVVIVFCINESKWYVILSIISAYDKSE